jgi:hypothetical protein
MGDGLTSGGADVGVLVIRIHVHTLTPPQGTQGAHHVSMRNLKTHCMAQPSGMAKAGVVYKHHNAGPPNMGYPSINTPSNDTKTHHPT